MSERFSEPAAALAYLRTPEAVRERAERLYALAEAGALRNVALDASRLGEAADRVALVIRDAYPALDIPYHARWRHFSVGGVDRWATLARGLLDRDAAEVARIRIDLCVPSVLLDAGAGPGWSYLERSSGRRLSRSEGLAVASLEAFAAGLFSADRDDPLRADAAALKRLSAADLGRAFQVSPANPLVGLEERAALIRRVGEALERRPDLFGSPARLGNLFDAVVGAAAANGPRPDAIPARAILAAVLEGFGPAWPSPTTLAGEKLGDVWPHPQIVTGDLTEGLVPFHKLSQWLTYSLLEVFEDAGHPVTGLEALTGLPEYRNGGLFIDTGVLRLKQPALAAAALPVEHPAVVEWRALTVALLDRIADPVRDRLGRNASDLPLARILEGGTWAAGRRIAAERRAGGGPPLTIASDGTVF